MHRAKKVLVPHVKPENLVKGICPIPPVCHVRPTHYIPQTNQELPTNTLPPIPKPRVGQGRAGIRRKPRVALPIPEGNQMPLPPISKPKPREMIPLNEPVTQSQGSILPQQQIPYLPKSSIQPTPADTTSPSKPKLGTRLVPPYPEPYYRPPPRPPDETIIKDSQKDLQNFDLDRRVEFEENSPHQEGIISET